MSAKDFADKLDRHIRQVQLWQLSRRGIIIDRVPNPHEMDNPIKASFTLAEKIRRN